MVNKKLQAWHEMPFPTTPSQIRDYGDACKEWLLEAVLKEPFMHRPRSTSIAFDVQQCENIGVHLEYIHPQNEFACFVCQKKTIVSAGKIVQANPFTRACAMLLCEECHAHFLRQ